MPAPRSQPALTPLDTKNVNGPSSPRSENSSTPLNPYLERISQIQPTIPDPLATKSGGASLNSASSRDLTSPARGISTASGGTGNAPASANSGLNSANLSQMSLASPGEDKLLLDHRHLQPGETASLLSHAQTLEMYRKNAKKTNDPHLNYELAVFMLDVARSLEDEVNNYEDEENPAAKERETLIKDSTALLKKLADRGHMDSQYLIGDCYANGFGVPRGKPDFSQAFIYFSLAGKRGHADAAYRAGTCYEKGWGCRRDASKAVQFYRRGASLNHSGAQYRLGTAELNGELGLKRSAREGVKWLKRSAESATPEFPHALHELALLHEKGIHNVLFADSEYSCDLLAQASQMGYAPSAYKLGVNYEYGRMGCPQDGGLSIHMYNIAAQQNHKEACFALTAWYLVGAPGILPQSDTEAYLWARRAADQGLAKAEYACGYFAENGVGTAKDIGEAKGWYLRAAEHGDSRANKRLQQLSGFAAKEVGSAAEDPSEAKKVSLQPLSAPFPGSTRSNSLGVLKYPSPMAMRETQATQRDAQYQALVSAVSERDRARELSALDPQGRISDFKPHVPAQPPSKGGKPMTVIAAGPGAALPPKPEPEPEPEPEQQPEQPESKKGIRFLNKMAEKTWAKNADKPPKNPDKQARQADKQAQKEAQKEEKRAQKEEKKAQKKAKKGKKGEEVEGEAAEGEKPAPDASEKPTEGKEEPTPADDQGSKTAEATNVPGSSDSGVLSSDDAKLSSSNAPPTGAITPSESGRKTASLYDTPEGTPKLDSNRLPGDEPEASGLSLVPARSPPGAPLGPTGPRNSMSLVPGRPLAPQPGRPLGLEPVRPVRPPHSPPPGIQPGQLFNPRSPPPGRSFGTPLSSTPPGHHGTPPIHPMGSNTPSPPFRPVPFGRSPLGVNMNPHTSQRNRPPFSAPGGTNASGSRPPLSPPSGLHPITMRPPMSPPPGGRQTDARQMSPQPGELQPSARPPMSPSSSRPPFSPNGQQPGARPPFGPNGQQPGTRPPFSPNGQQPGARPPFSPNGQQPGARPPFGPNGQQPNARPPFGPNGQQPNARPPFGPNGQQPGARPPFSPNGQQPGARPPFGPFAVQPPNGRPPFSPHTDVRPPNGHPPAHASQVQLPPSDSYSMNRESNQSPRIARPPSLPGAAANPAGRPPMGLTTPSIQSGQTAPTIGGLTRTSTIKPVRAPNVRSPTQLPTASGATPATGALRPGAPGEPTSVSSPPNSGGPTLAGFRPPPAFSSPRPGRPPNPPLSPSGAASLENTSASPLPPEDLPGNTPPADDGKKSGRKWFGMF